MLGKLKGMFWSRTIWVNLGMAVAGVLTEGLAKVGLDPQVYAAIVAVVNFGLRFITTESLEAKAG